MTLRAVVEIVKPEVELFWVMPVTFEPTPPLIKTLDPVPLLVIVPVLLTVFVEIVMPLAPALLFLKVRLPVPLMPPEWVKTGEPLLASVSPPAPSVVAPEIWTVGVPVLVIVLAEAPWVIAPEKSKLAPFWLWSRVRLLFSATLPLKVILFVAPVIVRVPEEPERTVILLVWVPLNEDLSVALALPLVSPRIIVPAPNAAADVVPVTVPLLIVKAPVKVFARLRVAVPVKAAPPDSPRVNPPAPLPHAALWAKVPLPMSVTVWAPFVTAPKVSNVTPVPPGLMILNFAFPVRVVAPKVKPAVPEVTLLPPCTMRVFAPIDNVPRV